VFRPAVKRLSMNRVAMPFSFTSLRVALASAATAAQGLSEIGARRFLSHVDHLLRVSRTREGQEPGGRCGARNGTENVLFALHDDLPRMTYGDKRAQAGVRPRCQFHPQA
jgi:hypothetical protein